MPSQPPSQDRVIRVFISSTFRDTVRERDLPEVFPDLRRGSVAGIMATVK